jgi:hypothetical protein
MIQDPNPQVQPATTEDVFSTLWLFDLFCRAHTTGSASIKMEVGGLSPTTGKFGPQKRTVETSEMFTAVSDGPEGCPEARAAYIAILQSIIPLEKWIKDRAEKAKEANPQTP